MLLNAGMFVSVMLFFSPGFVDDRRDFPGLSVTKCGHVRERDAGVKNFKQCARGSVDGFGSRGLRACSPPLPLRCVV